MKNTLAIVSLFLIAACATNKKYEAMLYSWLGHTENELVRSWGPPNEAYVSGGERRLTYSSSRSDCKASFTVERDRIVGWRYEGNACRAR